MKPTLIYLYGPPASGKLTVAEKLADLSGYVLFHNHLTVNAISSVFEFGSDSYMDVLHRLRLDVFKTAARSGVNLIFTNNSAWREPDARVRFAAFAAQTRQVVESEGGRVVFVKLSAPLPVLEERLANNSRQAQGKILDVEQLRTLMLNLDQSSLYRDDMNIDTSVANADKAARSIFELIK
jgi:predicted kinase